MKPIFWAVLAGIIFSLGCGGSRPPAREPGLLAIIPFTSGNLAGETEVLNEELSRALTSGGSFRLLFLQKQPALFDLSEMEVLQDVPSSWILTGRFTKEIIEESKGKRIPWVVYFPKVQYRVAAEVRLYHVNDKGWKFIREIEAGASRSGDFQAIEYDPAHPSLALSGTERQELRKKAYQQLFTKLSIILEKEMEIQR